MASNSKNIAELLNGDVTVTATDIADGSVTTAKLADGDITTAKLADNAVTGAKLYAENLGRRNLIINGAMQVAQRGTSISAPASSITYTLDRFFARPNSSTAGSVTQVTDAPEWFEYSARVRRSSGQTGTLTRFETCFETRDIIRLRGQKVTISFYAKAGSGYTPSSSNLSVLLFEGDGTEGKRSISSYDNETTLVNSPKTLTTSWQRFTHTTTANIASDTTQLALQFHASWSGTAPSGDEYYITGIQIESGDTATPFEHRSYDEEFSACQRYYQRTQSFMGNSHSVSGVVGLIDLHKPMRTNPTASQNGVFKVTDGYTADYTQSSTGFTLYASNASLNNSGYMFYINNISGLTSGRSYHARMNDTNDIILDAEL